MTAGTLESLAVDQTPHNDLPLGAQWPELFLLGCGAARRHIAAAGTHLARRSRIPPTNSPTGC